MSVLFFIAIAIVFGFVGGRLVHHLKLPGVVGYLVAGLVLGPSFLDVFSAPLLDKLEVFSSFALSLIAFIIGSEMKAATFREMGKGIGVITVAESFGAFLLVSAGVYLLTGKLFWALVFGAMAPASAPAGTVAVLQECRAKGRLTNALYAVVGLDDGLAIAIFAVAVALGKLMLTGGAISVGAIMGGPVLEIVGSIVLGAAVALVMGHFTRKMRAEDVVLAVSLGGILICAEVATYFHLSLILANLTFGMVLVNFFPAASQRAHNALHHISLPAYIIFFFIAGASLQVRLLPSMGLLGLVYVVCRIAGKVGGAFFGATVSRPSPVIRKYLGIGILSQAGVAIGLSVLAAGEFEMLGDAGRDLAIAVVNTIAATTILFEIIGPIGAKVAISRAGEAGLNITEQDLIDTYTVADMMETNAPTISAGMSLHEIIDLVGATDSSYYPVLDDSGRLKGAVTLDGVRKTFSSQELSDWLVALDIMEPVVAKLTPGMSLSEALKETHRLLVDHLPVVASESDEKFLGVLDAGSVHRKLGAELLGRQRQADRLHLAETAS